MGSNANQFTVALWKRERNWTELTFAETCGTVTKERKKNWSQVTGVFPVTMVKIVEGAFTLQFPFRFYSGKYIENNCRYHDSLLSIGELNALCVFSLGHN